MNTKSFSIMAAALLVLGSCSDQIDEPIIENPVQTGDEINFGTSLPSQIETRTVYGDEVTTGGDYDNGYFPVYWEDGDQITILCPQASNETRVDYEITPMDGKEYTSSDVTKIDQDKAGLQWGSDNEHEFFGFYPATAISGEANPTDGIVTVTIPVDQDPVSWYKDTDGTIVGRGNTDYAYMWAYNKVDKSTLEQGTPISLPFEPMSTVLEITINGPESGTMAISSVNVRSIDQTGTGQANTILTGDVQCDIRAAASNDGQAICTAVGDMDETRNQIFINLYGAGAYDDVENNGNGYPVLGPGDKLKVYAYLLPKDDNITKGTLQVTVSPVNQAAKVKTLQTADVIAHAINKVSLPALDEGEEGINYWMSSLDPDIYLTELSWPGSKMSMATYEKDQDYFLQSSSLTEQFELGVRAFDFQTKRRRAEVNWPIHIPGDPTIDVATEKQISLSRDGIATLHDALQELASCLATAEQADKKQEAVFVNISYAAPRFLGSLLADEDEWRDALISELENWTNDRVYTDEVTANTTLGDVAGKIVLRIHMKNVDTYNGFTTQLPAQLVNYDQPYTGELENMAWGTASNVNGLQLLHQEASRLNSEGGFLEMSDFDGNIQTKQEQVAAIVQESVRQYNSNDAHNIWYMMDLGGYFYSANVGGLLGESYNSLDVTETLTPHFFQYFNTREQNASLGVVLMNFADDNADYGAKYGCDYLLQTIIDNNFSFQLRTRGDTGGTTRSTSSVTHAAGSDGWDE